MPDKISDQDRRLIAEALAGGRVTVCPPFRHSPEPENDGWMARRDRAMARKHLDNAKNLAKGPVAKKRNGEKTRRDVAKLLEQGLSNKAIAEKLGLSLMHVGRVKKKLGE